MSKTWLIFIPFHQTFLLLFCIVLLFTALCSYLSRLPFPSLFPSCSVLVVPISLPSHVKVLVYWTGLKLSVSWSVTLCWICSARSSSHWLTILNEPTHVRRKHKLLSLIWWRTTANTSLPDLSATLLPFSLAHTHTHTVFLSCFLRSSDSTVGGKCRITELRNPWSSQPQIQTVILQEIFIRSSVSSH